MNKANEAVLYAMALSGDPEMRAGVYLGILLRPESGETSVVIETTTRGTTTIRFGESFTLSELSLADVKLLREAVGDAVLRAEWEKDH